MADDQPLKIPASPGAPPGGSLARRLLIVGAVLLIGLAVTAAVVAFWPRG